MAALTSLLKFILDKNMLTGPNFSDWLCNLRIVFTCERIAYVFKETMPASVADDASKKKKKVFKKWNEDEAIAKCYMLAGMSN